MVKFITYREDENGTESYYILQKEFPHFLGRIVENPYYKSLVAAPIPETTLYVALIGTLRGNMIPAYNNIDNDIKSAAINMAYWYFENRVNNNRKKFKRWLSKQQ